MRIIQGLGFVALATVCALSLDMPAGAVEVTIDSFTQANNTAFITATQVKVDMTGQSKTVTDSGLSGTIGGVRQLTVAATSVGPTDEVVAGSDNSPPRLCYQSTQRADGFVELVYDAGGSGLMPSDLYRAKGIEVDPVFADAAAVPFSIKLTLVDSTNTSASSVQNGTLPILTCPPNCPRMLFPFTDFPGVDPRHIRSITVQVDPSGGDEAAADLSLGPIRTYGTPNLAPAFSTGMISALTAMLGIFGLVKLRRARWKK